MFDFAQTGVTVKNKIADRSASLHVFKQLAGGAFLTPLANIDKAEIKSRNNSMVLTSQLPTVSDASPAAAAKYTEAKLSFLRKLDPIRHH